MKTFIIPNTKLSELFSDLKVFSVDRENLMTVRFKFDFELSLVSRTIVKTNGDWSKHPPSNVLWAWLMDQRLNITALAIAGDDQIDVVFHQNYVSIPARNATQATIWALELSRLSINYQE